MPCSTQSPHTHCIAHHRPSLLAPKARQPRWQIAPCAPHALVLSVFSSCSPCAPRPLLYLFVAEHCSPTVLRAAVTIRIVLVAVEEVVLVRQLFSRGNVAN